MSELKILRELYESARRLRMTAPVDDDFPLLMHEFDCAIKNAEKVIDTETGIFQPIEEKCPDCGHEWKYHSDHGCSGAFPEGTDGVDPQEVFYGECHCKNQSIIQVIEKAYRAGHTDGWLELDIEKGLATFLKFISNKTDKF